VESTLTQLFQNGLPRNRYTNSTTRMMTTASTRKNARLWLNWSTMKRYSSSAVRTFRVGRSLVGHTYRQSRQLIMTRRKHITKKFHGVIGVLRKLHHIQQHRMQSSSRPRSSLPRTISVACAAKSTFDNPPARQPSQLAPATHKGELETELSTP